MVRYFFIVGFLLLSISSQEHIIKQDFNKILLEIEFNKELLRRELIFNTITIIESENNHLARNGDNIGLVQIRPIMIKEVNTILKKNIYSNKDRYCPIKSREIFYIYTNYHTPNWNPELVTRRWNGGPNGENKLETLKYYLKFKKTYDSINYNDNYFYSRIN